jgi:antitoxin component of MazEF toxin-antitoxin module
MALVKRLSPVGNSAGLTFDKPILKQVGWERGDDIEVQVEGETIILRRHKFAPREEVAASAKRMIARHGKSLDKLGR